MKVRSESADVEEAGDDRRRLNNDEPMAAPNGFLVRFDEHPQSAGIDEIDVAHMQLDVSRVGIDRAQMVGKGVRCAGVNFARQVKTGWRGAHRQRLHSVAHRLSA